MLSELEAHKARLRIPGWEQTGLDTGAHRCIRRTAEQQGRCWNTGSSKETHRHSATLGELRNRTAVRFEVIADEREDMVKISRYPIYHRIPE